MAPGDDGSIWWLVRRDRSRRRSRRPRDRPRQRERARPRFRLLDVSTEVRSWPEEDWTWSELTSEQPHRPKLHCILKCRVSIYTGRFRFWPSRFCYCLSTLSGSEFSRFFSPKWEPEKEVAKLKLSDCPI